MSNFYQSSARTFNALSLRERLLFSATVVVVLCVAWWYFLLSPVMQQTSTQLEQNKRIENEILASQGAIDEIRARIDAGVHIEKEVKLARLKQVLKDAEDRMQLKTIELIDPEDMFQLMAQLIYKESKLKLVSLKRREVRPAIELSEGQKSDVGIYRHVLEVRFSGKYLDILRYMQSLEELDWKLIWDEIEIVSDNYPVISVKVVISTLSTRKEWVGV